MPIKKHPNIFINKILTGKNDSEGCIRIPTKYLNKLDIEIIDNLYLLSAETQTIEFLTKGNQIKKIIFLDNLGYRHEITLALKHG